MRLESWLRKTLPWERSSIQKQEALLQKWFMHFEMSLLGR